MEQINLDVLDGVLDRYLSRLNETRPQEIYKWEAVQHFQETFDVNASNVSAMLGDAFQEDKKLNLIFGGRWYPVGMLKIFAWNDPAGTIKALESLFDEQEDLLGRMKAFEAWAVEALKAHNDNRIADGEQPAKSHYQDARSMSVYLAFRHPESNYLYKSGMYRDAAKVLGVNWPGDKYEKVIEYRKMCEQILGYVRDKRPEILSASDATLGDLTKFDSEYHLLAQDIVYFIAVYDECPFALQQESIKTEQLGIDLPNEGVTNGQKVVDDLSGDIEEQFVKWSIEVCGHKEVYANQNLKILQKQGSETELMNEVLPQFESAFQCLDSAVIEEAYNRALDSPVNSMRHSRCSAALGNYLKFLEWWQGGKSELEEAVPAPVPAPYTDDDFLSDVYVSSEDLQDMKALLRRKKNLILQGSPGTGKTFCARRLAWAMMGCKDDARINFVQFHQSTTYDDFVCGYRPDGEGGFRIQDGPFVQACRAAARDPETDFFFIIDEINRANISKVFGELLMLIEADHRGESVWLTVGDKPLSVPENLYIIGMMNTADRGLALIDYALRRRFAFFEMEPAFRNEQFNDALQSCGDEKLVALAGATEKLNEQIADDTALGSGFRIGHSYFCADKDSLFPDARQVLRYELEPLISEYWFDDREKAEREIKNLEDALQ